MTVEATETTQAAETVELTFEFTDAAAAKALSILKAEGREDWFLRIQVTPGGCAGFQYKMGFTDAPMDGDVRNTFNGLGVAIDRTSAGYMNGAVIDYIETIEQQGFDIQNPNRAQSSCACGNSFC
ncbi:MAG: iron-sulfur cluster assembly accessory protein [Actinobacteria bacterium]|jgi:iron-sulfur cluster assembly accessory protein|nr:iron-sulfur cluster assembly accessory protein [Actinomycetota bacterium]